MKLVVLVFCAAALFAAWVGFGDRGIVHLRGLETEREARLERIRALGRENQSLMEEIQRLRTDVHYIEKVARRELGLIRDNEVIYRFAGDNTLDPGVAPRQPRRIETTKGR